MTKKRGTGGDSGAVGPAEMEQLEIITRPSELDRIEALLDEVNHLLFVMDNAPSGSAGDDTYIHEPPEEVLDEA